MTRYSLLTFFCIVSLLLPTPSTFAVVSEARSCVILEEGPTGPVDSFPEMPPVVADFDGDGLDDLALGDRQGFFEATLTILLSRGDGTFEVLAPFATRERQWALCAADLDGDGDVDLATAHSGVVLVHRNRGDGTFDAGLEFSSAQGRNTLITAAEVTGDDFVDLIAVASTSRIAAILPGLGDGRFGEPAEFLIASQSTALPADVLVADLDADDDNDLVFAVNDSIAMLSNEGDGSFAPAEMYDTDSRVPAFLDGGDLDRDGDIDLVVATRRFVDVFRNDGQGRLIRGESYSTQVPAESLVLEDLNGDGHLDLAWGGRCNNCFFVLTGDGTGTFHEPPPLDVTLGELLTQGDFDGDGDREIASVSREDGVRVVWVRLRGINFSSPSRHTVLQRDDSGSATFSVEGFSLADDTSRVEVRAVPVPGFRGTETEWVSQGGVDPCASFSKGLSVDEGWYQIEARALVGAEVVAESSLRGVGVGEVFVTAGQSNSIGGSPLAGLDARVTGMRDFGWHHAGDPLAGGGPWPALGDRLARRLDLPIGFVTTGVGGTQVEAWLPGTGLYERLSRAFRLVDYRFRGILWHQGESDAGLGAEFYAERLRRVIAQTRLDAGFDVPWGVALASICGGSASPSVVDGQRLVIEADPLVFEGANTDELGDEWRSDGCHFNEAGLREHGRRWDVSVARFFAYSSPPLRRGDVNVDGRVELADAISLLGYLFLGEDGLSCETAGDADDDGRLTIVDAVRVLRFAFGGEAEPANGLSSCARDVTPDELECASVGDCR